jgi:hypothetical protein
VLLEERERLVGRSRLHDAIAGVSDDLGGVHKDQKLVVDDEAMGSERFASGSISMTIWFAGVEGSGSRESDIYSISVLYDVATSTAAFMSGCFIRGCSLGRN